ncbi:hypothetical protein PG994_000937 [Apiospora phragmitis]|uniref:DNA (cytosine-5-)-methyltransferase n=1 Tax=Apiospora phragmitis TaxID=2905665 RepID=A0ABR1WR00_9PEZI
MSRDTVKVADDGSSVTAFKAEDISDDRDHSLELWNAVAEVIDLTEDEPAVKARRQTPSKRGAKVLTRRNEPIEPRLVVADRGSIVKRGNFVELEAALPGIWEAAFLLVQEVYRPADDDDGDNGLMLRGLPFTRTRCLRGKLPRYRNEVCLILQIDADDDRPDHVQAAVDVPLRHAMGTRNFHFTNAMFPAHRFDGTYGTTAADVERYAPLTCRWKYRLVYKDATSRVKTKAVPTEFVLAHINTDDEGVKAKFKVRESVLMNQWRGGKVEGGSYDKVAGVDLAVRDNLTLIEDNDENPGTEQQGIPMVKPVGQRYTFGDMFSGAGGASYGARCAGFHIRTACDHWKDALETYRHNFPETELHAKDIFALLSEVPDNGPELHVDVLHLSPPCQFWSPAHTVEGKNDEQNIAALMSCHQLIQKFRPRLFTLEQTFGILDLRFEYYFNALLVGFTQHGYSVRWRILRLENWGLPSPRKRLVILGSIKRYRTVYESLRGLPPPIHLDANTTARDNPLANLAADVDPLHRVQKLRDDTPWDPDAGLLRRAITCNGGYGNHHWSGERDFTRREYATLNGFPRGYQFRGRNYQRQIGNAFPARFTRALYRHLRGWLERADAGWWWGMCRGIGRRWCRRFRKRQPATLPVVEWKDDEDDDDMADDDLMEIDGTGGGDLILISQTRPVLLCVDANQRAPPPPPRDPWNFPASSLEDPIDLDNDGDALY